jgi:hypothetical protein
MSRECGVRVGQIFRDAKPPHRAWRVTENREGLCRIERLDRPNIVRYPHCTALLDSNRYAGEA